MLESKKRDSTIQDDIYDTAITDCNLLAKYGLFKTDDDFLVFLKHRIDFYTKCIETHGVKNDS